LETEHSGQSLGVPRNPGSAIIPEKIMDTVSVLEQEIRKTPGIPQILEALKILSRSTEA